MPDWLVNEAKIAPHIPVVDKSKREDGTFSREDFTFDKGRNRLPLPGRQGSHHDGKLVNDGETLLYLETIRARERMAGAIGQHCALNTQPRQSRVLGWRELKELPSRSCRC